MRQKHAGVEAKIVAVADIFPEAARKGVENFGVPEDKCFSGFDAYQKALAVPGVNYAILATPPGFRASHFKAAIEAGKNVFMEKPVAVDGAGCQVMYAAAEMAKQKNLKVAAGTQRRHQAGYIETIKRIKDGAIGDIVTLRAYWVNGGPIWHRGDSAAPNSNGRFATGTTTSGSAATIFANSTSTTSTSATGSSATTPRSAGAWAPASS